MNCARNSSITIPATRRGKEEVTNMIWNILYEAGAIGLNNGHFPTQAREPPVGEGFGSQSEQAPEGGNDSRLVKGE